MKKKNRPPTPAPSPEALLDVQVAALVALYDWEGRTSPVVYIGVNPPERRLLFGLYEPDEAVILRLFGHDIEARPISQRAVDEKEFMIVPETGEQSFLLGIGQITWHSPSHAVVDAHYARGPRWGSTFRLSLRLIDGLWSVESIANTGMI